MLWLERPSSPVEYISVFHGRRWRDTLIREIGARFSVSSFVGWFTNRRLHHLLFICFFYLNAPSEESRLSIKGFLILGASSLATRRIFVSRLWNAGGVLPNPSVTQWPCHTLAAEHRCDLCQVHSSSWTRGLYHVAHPKSKIYLGCWILIWWTYLPTPRNNITPAEFPLMPNMEEVSLCTLQSNQTFFSFLSFFVVQNLDLCPKKRLVLNTETCKFRGSSVTEYRTCFRNTLESVMVFDND